MKRSLVLICGIGLIGGSVVYGGEARSVSSASGGGSASATATAVGNANSLAIAGASRGGRAISNSHAIGTRGGYADSRSVAMAERGLAISNSNADARGVWGGRAVADSESVAATYGGVAISNSDARSQGVFGGQARSHSTSTALSRWGVATSDSRANSHSAFWGRAVSRSDSLAELSELARSAGVDVLAEMVQRRQKIHPRTVIGPGKLREIVVKAMQAGAVTLIFDRELSPAQVNAIQKFTVECPVCKSCIKIPQSILP